MLGAPHAPPLDLGQRTSGLSLNLSSNNPFRNRAVSPALPSPFDDPPPRPVSRNPFLDPAVTTRSSLQNLRSTSEAMSFEKKSSPTAEDLFVCLPLLAFPAMLWLSRTLSYNTGETNRRDGRAHCRSTTKSRTPSPRHDPMLRGRLRVAAPLLPRVERTPRPAVEPLPGPTARRARRKKRSVRGECRAAMMSSQVLRTPLVRRRDDQIDARVGTRSLQFWTLIGS